MLNGKACAHYVIGQRASRYNVERLNVRSVRGYGANAMSVLGTNETTMDVNSSVVKEEEVESMAAEVVALRKRTLEASVSEANTGVPKTFVAACTKTIDLTADDADDGTLSSAYATKRREAMARCQGKRKFSDFSKEKSLLVLTEFKDHSPWCYKSTKVEAKAQ